MSTDPKPHKLYDLTLINNEIRYRGIIRRFHCLLMLPYKNAKRPLHISTK